MVIYPQQHSSDKSLPSQLQLPSLDKSQPDINPEYEKALKEYEELIKKYPDKKELYYNLGNLNYLSGDIEAALQNYKNSLTDSDSQQKAHTLYNMGNAMYQMGDLQKSVELFKEALTLSPDDDDSCRNDPTGEGPGTRCRRRRSAGNCNGTPPWGRS